MFEHFCKVQFHIVYLVLIITHLLHKYATLIVYPTDSGDGEKDIILPESTKHTTSNIDKDAGNGMIESMLEPHLKRKAMASQAEVGVSFFILGGAFMVFTPIGGLVR